MEIPECPICCNGFSTDLSLLASSSSSPKKHHRLPVSCTVCSYTMCYSCVLRERERQFEQTRSRRPRKYVACICGARQAFSAEKPCINRPLCRMIDQCQSYALVVQLRKEEDPPSENDGIGDKRAALEREIRSSRTRCFRNTRIRRPKRARVDDMIRCFDEEERESSRPRIHQTTDVDRHQQQPNSASSAVESSEVDNNDNEDQRTHVDVNDEDAVDYSTVNEGPSHISVENAGCPEVNGLYRLEGYCETACRYVREGHWNGQVHTFNIYKFHASDDTMHWWYISIVPDGGNPGTPDDIDFYYATPATDARARRVVPPREGWEPVVRGRDPPPSLSYLHGPVSRA